MQECKVGEGNITVGASWGRVSHEGREGHVTQSLAGINYRSGWRKYILISLADGYLRPAPSQHDNIFTTDRHSPIIYPLCTCRITHLMERDRKGRGEETIRDLLTLWQIARWKELGDQCFPIISYFSPPRSLLYSIIRMYTVKGDCKGK